ncbi:formylglycine-generating enzyme family protein [Methylomagnum ishizawai]|nr:SUMF1/EgtB/PvdO family nonheme iron enzyme [Methylomagnum ishizawai]
MADWGLGLLLWLAGGLALGADGLDALNDPAKPLPDDVALPMPCGGKMVFRRVETAGGGALGEQKLRLGEENPGAVLGPKEGAVDAYLAGAFPIAGNAARRYFLLGKYEVTQRQYEAVRRSLAHKDGPLDCQGLPEENFPKAGLSWFDAVAFADGYTQWLLANAQDQVPKDGKSLGFVRLPTEVEWEFAARGGNAVNEADFRGPNFIKDGELYRYVQHQGTESANGKVQYIGLLGPNPLGLYDILGNVDEMAFDLFHLTKHSHWHGRAGGFVVRGGNFDTAAGDIRSSLRREEPYYTDKQPRRAETTGFRVAVAGPVISEQNLRAIEAEWANLKDEAAPSRAAQPQPQPAPPTPTPDPRLAQRLGQAEAALQHCQAAQAAVVPIGPAPVQSGAVVSACPDPLGKLSNESRSDLLADISDLASQANHPLLRRRLNHVWGETARVIEFQNEDRRRAAREALRTAAMICQKLRDDEYNVIEPWENRKKAHCLRDTKGQDCLNDETRILKLKDRVANNLGFYADAVLELARSYPMDILTAEKDLLLTRIEQRRYQDFMPFVKLLYGHAQRYAADGKQNREAWYRDCAAVRLE